MVQTETEECIGQTAGTRSADHPRFLAEAEMRAADPNEYLDMDDSDVDDYEAVPDRNAAVLDLCQSTSGGQLDVFGSKESLRNPSSGVTNPDTTRH